MNPTAALIELHFLPGLEYLSALRSFGDVVFEKHENYQKQSYRNRCFINSAQGVQMLVVPLTGKHGKVSIAEVRIDYRQRWQNVMWRTIESAYANGAYYEHYEGDLRKIIYTEYNFLYELNSALLSFCLQSLHWPLRWSESVSYEKTPGGNIRDLRNIISAKKTFQDRQFYRPVPYFQLFGNRFVPNLSFIDLLFSTGPSALDIVDQSSTAN